MNRVGDHFTCVGLFCGCSGFTLDMLGAGFWNLATMHVAWVPGDHANVGIPNVRR